MAILLKFFCVSPISFSFDGLKISDSDVEKLTKSLAKPRHSNPSKPWGSYNLKLSVGISNTEKESSFQLPMKRWSIETCYGYWAPSCYSDRIDAIQEKKKISVKNELALILEQINEKGIQNICKEYEEYVNDVRIIYRESRIKFPFNKKDCDAIFDRYYRFVSRTIEKLNDKKIIDKVSTPLLSSNMPEIWQDHAAKNKFIESFLDSISYELEKSQPHTPIILSLENHLGLDQIDTPDIIHEKFNDFFTSNSWEESVWMKSKI